VTTSQSIVAGYLFDWIAGDPEWMPHPVRAIGGAIEQGERLLRSPNQTAEIQLVAGGALTFAIVATSYMGTQWVIRRAHRRGCGVGFLAESALAWTCLASRNLHDEASSVMAALERDDLILARQRLARIVGRDTETLEEPEVLRALIETLAESASDGVIAPLFYMALGGVPLAMAYKAINTLDSMIGHADEHYFYFGKAAARLDDIANFLPARLTAFGIAASAIFIEDASPGSAIKTWLSDGNKHKSPNAGQPEGAMAGALKIRLGGANFYDGVLTPTPTIGERFAQTSRHNAKQAIRIVAAVSSLGLLGALWLRNKRS